MRYIGQYRKIPVYKVDTYLEYLGNARPDHLFILEGKLIRDGIIIGTVDANNVVAECEHKELADEYKYQSQSTMDERSEAIDDILANAMKPLHIDYDIDLQGMMYSD